MRGAGVLYVMRKYINIISFILLLSAWVSAIAQPSSDATLHTLLQEDFQIMRSALEQAHGGIYRYSSKREMDRVFDQAYRQIQKPMTDLEFWQLAAPAVAKIKCGHTALWLPNETTARLMTNIPALPLVVRIFNDRPYVYRDLLNIGSSLKGSEILSINRIPAKALVRKMKTFVTGDGDSMSAKSYRVGHYGNFRYSSTRSKLRAPSN